VAPVGPVAPVAPEVLGSSSTITKVPFKGTIREKNIVALLMLTSDRVTGAVVTSTIPIP
jgi:hypothetical protein